MSQRPLWFEVAGKREVVGRVEFDYEPGVRIIAAEPAETINPSDIAIMILETTLNAWGYKHKVSSKGVVVVVVGINESYGQVCREIARAYFLAINSPNPRRPSNE